MAGTGQRPRRQLEGGWRMAEGGGQWAAALMAASLLAAFADGHTRPSFRPPPSALRPPPSAIRPLPSAICHRPLPSALCPPPSALCLCPPPSAICHPKLPRECPFNLPDHPEENRHLARVEIRAAGDRAQVVVDAIGVVLMEESDFEQELARALVEALDDFGLRELAIDRLRLDR